MTLKNKNPWKYLSVGLLGVIAIGLFAPVQAAPGDAQSGWQVALAGLQGQIDSLNVDDADNDPTNELQTLSESVTGTPTAVVDLDKVDETAELTCGNNAYIQKLKFESCPGGTTCGPNGKIIFKAECTTISINP